MNFDREPGKFTKRMSHFMPTYLVLRLFISASLLRIYADNDTYPRVSVRSEADD